MTIAEMVARFVQRTRTERGLPERIVDAAVLDRVAALTQQTSPVQQPTEKRR